VSRLAQTRSYSFLLLAACVVVDEPPALEKNEAFYGPCEDEHGRVICLEEAPACDYYPDFDFPEMSVCTIECAQDEDCAIPETGTAVVKCTGAPSACVLGCSGGETCPEEMVCAPTGACMWET
jgi:hypothetical protein